MAARAHLPCQRVNLWPTQGPLRESYLFSADLYRDVCGCRVPVKEECLDFPGSDLTFRLSKGQQIQGELGSLALAVAAMTGG